MENSILNINKIKKGNKIINNLKHNIKELDTFYNTFNNINLV